MLITEISNLSDKTTTNTIRLVRDIQLQLRDYKICERSKLEKILVAALLEETCEDCIKMAAIPQGAFAACKIREQFKERDMLLARMKRGDETDPKNKPENKKKLEYAPMKYSDKLMNAIWGIYNRYSPHNIKSNDCEESGKKFFVQQPTAVATYAAVQNVSMNWNSGTEYATKTE